MRRPGAFERALSPSTCLEFRQSSSSQPLGGVPIRHEHNADTKTLAGKKQINLTARQADELMRRFNDLEVAHFELQTKYGKLASRLEQCLFKLHKQTQLKENLEG